MKDCANKTHNPGFTMGGKRDLDPSLSGAELKQEKNNWIVRRAKSVLGH
jgi:hypothetical protein